MDAKEHQVIAVTIRLRTLRVAVAFALLWPAAAATMAEDIRSETLLIGMPQGFKIGSQGQQQNSSRITEMVPASETVESWTEMVTVQTFPGLRAPPERFESRLIDSWRTACPKSDDHHIAQGAENGYSFVLWLLSCPLNQASGKPEIAWFKAIAGNDSFYVVQKAFRFAPSREQIAAWMAFLKDAKVCDTRLPDRPCPDLKPLKP
jgi:hypothetical protein